MIQNWEGKRREGTRSTRILGWNKRPPSPSALSVTLFPPLIQRTEPRGCATARSLPAAPRAQPPETKTEGSRPSRSLQQLVVVLVWQGLVHRLLQLRLDLGLGLHVDDDVWRREGWGLHQGQRVVAHKLPREVNEGLLVLVVGPRADLEVLEVLLPVEDDVLGLHLPVLGVNLVAAQHDRDVLAHPSQVAVPHGDGLVGQPGGNVEHDDRAVGVDVVALPEAAELLLSGSVPAVKPQSTVVRMKVERVDLHADRGLVRLLELSGLVPLHEGRLPGSSVPDQDKLELGDALLPLHAWERLFFFLSSACERKRPVPATTKSRST